MWKKITDKAIEKDSKSGIQSLTLIVGVLIAFAAIAGLMDLTALQTKFSTISTQTGYVSRAIAKQGGVSTEQIDNFRGRYVTSAELYNNVSSAMNYAGIADNEWELRVAGQVLSPSTQTKIFDRGERIPVSIKIKYGWPAISSFIPVKTGNTRTTRTEVVSTYEIRDGGFSEESWD